MAHGIGSDMTDGVTRIVLAALGGEGGGVLMNWMVAAAREAGHVVQATSVPGVAQRTGSTSYYIEVAPKHAPDTVLGLVPLAGRVDVLVSSELVETARVLAEGFVSPSRTTVVSSTARFYATAEKIDMGDGRYSDENVRRALDGMARESFLLDLGKLATDNGTFVSATMFGAVAGSSVLPWDVEASRAVLVDDRSRAGFDAALAAVGQLKTSGIAKEPEQDKTPAGFDHLSDGLRNVMMHGAERVEDFQDADYRALFEDRAGRLIAAADQTDTKSLHACTEAIRRLALWMAYEDVARVADLKTRPERFENIHKEVQLEPGQILKITEYMKPRAEEIADILPEELGRRIMARAQRGGWFPFLGKGRYIRSNGIIGYWLLRMVAALKRIRRRSLRFHEEQTAIEDWLNLMEIAISRAPDFATALGELPRVQKGYSDTLLRGKRAYTMIIDAIVRPAIADGTEAETAKTLRDAIGAAMADDSHAKLDAFLAGTDPEPAMPILKQVAHG